MSDHPYHSIGARQDRARTWAYLDRIAIALEKLVSIEEVLTEPAPNREPTAADMVAYLHRLRDEGCTFTEIGDPTDNLDVPVTVFHDGETCPVHEVES